MRNSWGSCGDKWHTTGFTGENDRRFSFTKKPKVVSQMSHRISSWTIYKLCSRLMCDRELSVLVRTETWFTSGQDADFEVKLMSFCAPSTALQSSTRYYTLSVNPEPGVTLLLNTFLPKLPITCWQTIQCIQQSATVALTNKLCFWI